MLLLSLTKMALPHAYTSDLIKKPVNAILLVVTTHTRTDNERCQFTL